MKGGFGLALCYPGNRANLDLVVVLEIVTGGEKLSVCEQFSQQPR